MDPAVNPQAGRRPFGVFPLFFALVQALFLWWVIAGQKIVCTAPDGGPCNGAQQAGHALGGAAAFVFQVFLWAVVDILLAIGYLIYRRT